ncbi:MAG: tetratricopeptide repeat protein, partial [Paludibacteraceae bacterium]|nr:tetratricopeptide repeat protein [Paludibacteraceae bacterium]
LTKQYLRYQLATDAYAQGKMKYVLQWTDELLNNPLGDEYKNEAYYFRAEANYQQRDFAAAQQDIATFINRSTATQSPNYAAALYLDAYIAFNQQDFGQAQKRFEAYLQAAPSNQPAYADALNRLGDCAFHVRAFEKAISYYQQAVATNQATVVPYALFQQGYAEGLLHQYDKKINTLNTLVSRYPKSDYSAEALYQIARSYVQQDDITQALVTYQNLVASYPTSSQARPAHLEIAMLYRNQGNYDKAIEAYQKTIARYPAGEEAYAALNGMENIYVETNRIDEYLNYTKTLADKQMHINTQEDSLSFAAAEMQFMTNHPKEALPHYISLAARTGSRYQLPSAAKASQICLEAKDYEQALPLFNQYLALASSSAEREEARLGILTCAEELHNDDLIIQTASQLLSEGASPALTDKALYLRGTAYMRQQSYENAIADLQPLAQNTLTAQGAEAQY